MIHNKNDKLCKSFGKKLKFYREYAGYSQETLANESDISISQVSRLERGLLNPTLSTLYQISSALNISLEELVSEL